MQSSPQTRGRGQLRLRLPQREQSMMLWGRRQERASVVDPNMNSRCIDVPIPSKLEEAERPLKLLSYNIQVGIKTSAYRQYLTRGWKHILPHENRQKNLSDIANVVNDYDVVALQEIDGGSLRSGYINQVEYLAQMGEFPYWYAQTNRDLGPIAQHGNGLLTKLKPHSVEDHKLPGAIPGRGAVIVRMPYAGDELVVVMLHLSLGERSRRKQLAYVAEQIAHERQVVLMGDMNTPMASLMEDSALKTLGLVSAENSQPTYPAWDPSLALDHVLVSPNLVIKDFQVLGHRMSDHLPIAVEIAAANRPSLQ